MCIENRIKMDKVFLPHIKIKKRCWNSHHVDSWMITWTCQFIRPILPCLNNGPFPPKLNNSSSLPWSPCRLFFLMEIGLASSNPKQNPKSKKKSPKRRGDRVWIFSWKKTHQIPKMYNEKKLQKKTLDSWRVESWRWKLSPKNSPPHCPPSKLLQSLLHPQCDGRCCVPRGRTEWLSGARPAGRSLVVEKSLYLVEIATRWAPTSWKNWDYDP